LFITNGIHRDEIEKKGIEKILKNYNVKTNYTQTELQW